MPLHSLRRLVLFLLPAALCACSTIQPQGALKAVIKDENSETAPVTPEEQKKIEDHLRQTNQQTPIPKEKKGTLGFKIPF
jgi:hypothetical protein